MSTAYSSRAVAVKNPKPPYHGIIYNKYIDIYNDNNNKKLSNMTELLFQKKWLNSSYLETQLESFAVVFKCLSFQPASQNFDLLLETTSNRSLRISDLTFTLLSPIELVFFGTQTNDHLSVRLRKERWTSNRVIIYRSCLLRCV